MAARMDTATSTESTSLFVALRAAGINLRLVPFFIVTFIVSVFATEPLKPVLPPQNAIALSGVGELRDDVYSADLKWSVEVAPCNCLSFYTDMSYRFISYEWQTMLHDQIHEMVNLQVNGLNESFVGMKFFPIQYFGLNVSWRFKPGNGSRVERFERLGIEPMGVYRFSPNMVLGLSGQYYSFIEDKNYQPGDELGVKTSFVWNAFWDKYARTGWQVGYVFLFRWRIQESENHNLAKDYQKMDDLYRGFRMRGDIARYVGWFPFPFGMGMAYEMNRGNLFGFETGHKVELYLRAEFP